MGLKFAPQAVSGDSSSQIEYAESPESPPLCGPCKVLLFHFDRAVPAEAARSALSRCVRCGNSGRLRPIAPDSLLQLLAGAEPAFNASEQRFR